MIASFASSSCLRSHVVISPIIVNYISYKTTFSKHDHYDDQEELNKCFGSSLIFVRTKALSFLLPAKTD